MNWHANTRQVKQSSLFSVAFSDKEKSFIASSPGTADGADSCCLLSEELTEFSCPVESP
jgi:hypothetical protein